MRLFPLLPVLSVSALLATMTACSKDEAEVEDCSNGIDDDEDGDVDCDDAQCATDSECGDTEPVGDEDCSNGSDDDGDDDVDCDDSDCEGTADCPAEDCGNGTDDDGDGAIDCDDSGCDTSEDCMYVWIETGAATVIPGVSYLGTTEWSFTTTQGVDLCTYEMDATSTAPAADCTGCDFAFTVSLTDGQGVSGDCAGNFELTNGASYEYGYGYDADYNYNGTVIPSLMYNYAGTWYSWYYYGATATFDGTNFDYEWVIAYEYY